ncbi:MAG TPA: glycerol-3-phosphate acyltransferase [Ignavibacteriaceae bacterium]|jgi:glycerol-3-phosphate acyltransferase PlsY|nr:glycerol-3-phosphate acyltransferase [Ignavibacteriaceae bacterium]
MEYLLSFIIGYLLGSFPAGYIILKKSRGINITEEGSGNVGAMNSYELTNSKFIGLLVMVIDALKGLFSVYIILLIFPLNFIFPAIALFCAVFAHCYNPWLGFKGGRGLATAAGGSSLLFPFALILWGVLWLAIYIYQKDILWANVWATIMALIIILTSPGIAVKYSFPRAATQGELILFSIALLILIFVRHIDPFKEIIKNKNFIRKVKR